MHKIDKCNNKMVEKKSGAGESSVVKALSALSKTQVSFPAPTRWLIIIWNSSSKDVRLWTWELQITSSQGHRNPRDESMVGLGTKPQTSEAEVGPKHTPDVEKA